MQRLAVLARTQLGEPCLVVDHAQRELGEQLAALAGRELPPCWERVHCSGDRRSDQRIVRINDVGDVRAIERIAHREAMPRVMPAAGDVCVTRDVHG